MPFCPNCGKEVQEDSQFCPQCGFLLKRSASVAASDIKPSPSSSGVEVAKQDLSFEAESSATKTLVLIAMIAQGVIFVVAIAVASLFLSFVGTGGGITVTDGNTNATALFSGPVGGSLAFGFVVLIFVTGFFLSAVWIVLDFLLVYRNLDTASNIERARAPSLILGVIQLVGGGVVPGLLLLFAYLKIGDWIGGKTDLRVNTESA
jgi:zinc-ribbon domain